MNAKVMIVITSACVVIACSFAGWQWRIAAELKKRNTDLRVQVEEKEKAASAQAAVIARLEQSTVLGEKPAADEAAEVASASVTPGAAPPSTVGEESATELFRRTLHDPPTRERRRRILKSWLKQNYGDFVRARGLNPVQTDEFLDLLTDKQMNEDEDSANFLAGHKDEDDASQSAATEWAEIDTQLRALLSQEDYTQFQEYEKTIGDRVTLAQIHRELAINTQPLNDDQANFLSQVLRDERLLTPPLAYDPRSSGRSRDKYQLALEGDNATRFFEVQADLNQRILGRVKNVLSPEQYETLASLQRQNIEATRSTIELARKAIARETAPPSIP